MIEPEINFLTRIIAYCQEKRNLIGRSDLDPLAAMCVERKKQLSSHKEKK